jgi:hypothetical protein
MSNNMWTYLPRSANCASSFASAIDPGSKPSPMEKLTVACGHDLGTFMKTIYSNKLPSEHQVAPSKINSVSALLSSLPPDAGSRILFGVGRLLANPFGVDCRPALLRDGKAQPQLANIEYLFSAAGFVVNRYIKSCKPTLTVKSALRFADEQKLGDD